MFAIFYFMLRKINFSIKIKKFNGKNISFASFTVSLLLVDQS